MNENERWMAGATITGLLLAALHWLPWAKDLPRLVAYVIGCSAIWAGQGVYLRFDRRWRRLFLFPAIGGLVTGTCWLYDAAANGLFRVEDAKGEQWRRPTTGTENASS